jgi:ATP-dependent protease ClpP protease subunit
MASDQMMACRDAMLQDNAKNLRGLVLQEVEKQQQADREETIAKWRDSRYTTITNGDTFTVTITGMIVEFNIMDIKQDLFHAQRDGCRIFIIVLHSMGGDAYAGVQMYHMLRMFRKCKNARLEMRVVGQAASVATVIALGAKRRHRYIEATGGMLIHSASLEGATRDAITDMYNKELVTIYASESNKSKKYFKQLLKSGEDHHFTTQQLVKMGFFNKGNVIETKKKGKSKK